MAPEIILAFIAVMTMVAVGAWLNNKSLRVRQEEVRAGAGEVESSRLVELLSSENGALKGQIGRLEERIATLERIVTDPAERTAREIEQLRR